MVQRLRSPVFSAGRNMKMAHTAFPKLDFNAFDQLSADPLSPVFLHHIEVRDSAAFIGAAHCLAYASAAIPDYPASLGGDADDLGHVEFEGFRDFVRDVAAFPAEKVVYYYELRRVGGFCQTYIDHLFTIHHAIECRKIFFYKDTLMII